MWQNFLNIFLEQSVPKISKCYRMVNAFIAEEYSELVEEIQSEACVRRKIKTIPFAVLEYSYNSEKILHDHCTPLSNDYDNEN